MHIDDFVPTEARVQPPRDNRPNFGGGRGRGADRGRGRGRGRGREIHLKDENAFPSLGSR